MTKHKGVYYFALRETAEAALQAAQWTHGRIVAYKRGYAVQLHKSGPYMPQVIVAERHKCKWCPK